MGNDFDVFNEDDFTFGDGSDISQQGLGQNRPNHRTAEDYNAIKGNVEMATVETVGDSNAYRGDKGQLGQERFKPTRKKQDSIIPEEKPVKKKIYTYEELVQLVNRGKINEQQAQNYIKKHNIQVPDTQTKHIYTMEELNQLVSSGKITLEQAQNYISNNYPNEGKNENKPVNKKSGKKKSKLPIIGIILLIVIILFVVKGLSGKPKEKVPSYSFDSSTFVEFENLLHNYDATAIDEKVGSEDGDSYIAQEWSYANVDEDKEDFIKQVCGVVKFSYPQSEGESIKVAIPDYNKVSEDILNDYDYIQKLYESSGYAEKDYTYYQEVYDLVLYYIDKKYGENLPVTTVDCDIKAFNGVIEDDSNLDDLLFGSDAWHSVLDSFQKAMTNWTGTKDEVYYEKETQQNPEYDEWFAIFLKYYQEDGGTYDEKTDTLSGGKFVKGKSKWEPWYKRDEKDPDKIIKDKDGNKVVNYYSVKKKDGTDWIQPDRYIEVDVEKTRQVDDPFIAENPIRYGYLGAHWIETTECSYDTTVQVGDGTIEFPAGIGTTIITKLYGNDGMYHDVKVTLTGYWVGQDAIDYAVEFSDKNRGFVSDSVVQLICFEYKLENLEDEDFVFDGGEFCLMNSSSSKTSRTGTIYGLKQGGTLKAHEPELFNDWATSTEIEQKYLCWGLSFDRQYPAIYFRILAGDGDVPTYSAYEQFTGKSEVK